jgi:hypothetical protein
MLHSYACRSFEAKCSNDSPAGAILGIQSVNGISAIGDYPSFEAVQKAFTIVEGLYGISSSEFALYGYAVPYVRAYEGNHQRP